VNEFTRNCRRIAAAAVAASLFTVAAHGQQQQEQATSSADAFNIPENITILGANSPNTRRATAIVNGTIITGTDVDHRVALVLAESEAGQVPAEELQRLRLQVLRNLIDETLQIQEAQAQEIAVTPEDVENTFKRVVASRNRTPEQENEYLRSIGSSAASLKRQIEGEMSWDRLMRRNIAPFVNVSEGEATELWERLQSSRGTEEYRIGEIFLSATPTTKTAVADNARQIIEQLRQGGSFVAYARQFSEASTAAVGGDLGWIRLEQLQNPQLEQVAAGLSPGQLAGPIEIPGGYWIVYLIDKRQVGMADPRDALLSLKQIALDFSNGLPEAEARARAEQFAKAVTEIRGCGEADSAAAAVGATVVSNDQIPLRSLPEALQPIMLELNVGQATPPFGALNEGVRVLMLCGRDDPQAQAGPDREALMNQLQEERINRRAQRYLRDLRRDAVIEYN
jgi:peptidyl-prolyl cis-trans isomerase SurA